MKKTILLLLQLLATLPTKGMCQEVATIFTSDTIEMTSPPDQLYILPNKDIYETGEDLWFKAWLLNRADLSLSDKSKTLYLCMYSPTDSLVWSEMYPIKDGRCDGHLYISDKWAEGEYKLEGYTKSTFLADSTTAIHPRKIIVVKNISQLDSLSTTLAKTDSLPKDFVLRIYPEGGRLIEGITNKIVFKATNGKGFPISVEGMVLDNGNDLCPLKNIHDGMGFFTIRPKQAHHYTLRLSNGEEYSLPELLQDSNMSMRQGMSVSLAGQDEETTQILIHQSPEKPQQRFLLVVQMRGIPCCHASGVLKDSILVNIPLNNFPFQGVAELTLFDASMQPVAERLIYVHPQRKLNITTKTDHQYYYRRDEGKVSIKVTDEEGHPVQAELCLSLFDKWYQSSRVAETMLSHCYLTEQIRSSVFHPCYYFDTRNKNRHHDLDLLLMTQGWPHYATTVGDVVLTDGITGRVFYGTKHRKELDTGIQAIQASSANASSQLVWPDSLGHFTLSPSLMEQLRSGYIYLKPLLPKDAKAQLEMANPFASIPALRNKKPTYSTMGVSNPSVNETSFDITTGLGTYQLQGVTVTAKHKKPFTDKMMGTLDSMAIKKFSKGWVCQHLNAKGEVEYEFLNDYETGYTCDFFHNHHEHPDIIRITRPIDGRSYYMVKMAPWKRSDYAVAVGGKWAVYHDPKFTEKQLLKMYNTYQVKGYYGQREFHQPDKAELMTNLPDARNTLLWVPSIVTDENGEAEIPFLTSDDTGPFVGIVEGTNGLGLLGSTTFEFYVKRNVDDTTPHQ